MISAAGAIVTGAKAAYDSLTGNDSAYSEKVEDSTSPEAGDASGDGGEPRAEGLDRNPADDQRLSKGEIKALEEGGENAHEIKGGENASTSKRDLFKDKDGNIYVKPKDGSGPGEPTGLNVKDYKIK